MGRWREWAKWLTLFIVKLGLFILAVRVFAWLLTWLIQNPESLWFSVLMWAVFVIGWLWFVRNVTLHWYPVLKEKFGLARVYQVLVGLNALAWLPGFFFARFAINSLTGVDAGNFTTALWAFTLGGIAYVWLVLILLVIGLMTLKSLVMVFILMVWEETRSFLWGLILSEPPRRPMPIGRHLMDMLASWCVIVLLALVPGNATTRSIVRVVATLVLVATEFSHDHTCAASSKTRWVAPLKDRKELKVSNVLIADVQSLTNIQFLIGHCQNEYPVFDWAMLIGGDEPAMPNFG